MSLNKIKIKNYSLNIANKSRVKIMLLSDLHYSSHFNDFKLVEIKNKLKKHHYDYLFIAGDIIDSTNFLYTNKIKKERLVNWFKDISKYSKIFIVLGNHDISKSENGRWKEDFHHSFWKHISNIDNIYLSKNCSFYEDDNITVDFIDLGFNYYKNKQEDFKILKSELLGLQKIKSDHKINILLLHSPICITNKEIKPYIKQYDLIFTGHMHNGTTPEFLKWLFGKNIGLISPHKNLFPDNARGLKKIKVNNKNTYLFISGGITKLAECTKNLFKLNDLFFKMDIEYIQINKEK